MINELLKGLPRIKCQLKNTPGKTYVHTEDSAFYLTPTTLIYNEDVKFIYKPLQLDDPSESDSSDLLNEFLDEDYETVDSTEDGVLVHSKSIKTYDKNELSFTRHLDTNDNEEKLLLDYHQFHIGFNLKNIDEVFYELLKWKLYGC